MVFDAGNVVGKRDENFHLVFALALLLSHLRDIYTQPATTKHIQKIAIKIWSKNRKGVVSSIHQATLGANRSSPHQ